MAANVLNSPEAVKMSVHVVRAFIKQRELLAGQAEILKKLALMDAKLLKHDDALRVIWRELQPLLAPPSAPPREEIGFHVREDAPTFGTKSKKTGVEKAFVVTGHRGGSCVEIRTSNAHPLQIHSPRPRPRRRIFRLRPAGTEYADTTRPRTNTC